MISIMTIFGMVGCGEIIDTVEDRPAPIIENNQTTEDNNQTIEDNNQTTEDNNQTTEDNNQTTEDNNQTIEDNNQTIEDNNQTTPTIERKNAQYLDSKVSGVYFLSLAKCYDINSTTKMCDESIKGTTSNGIFSFIPGGDIVGMKIAGLTLDLIPQKYLIENAVLTVRKTDGKLASFLQSMDSDANASNGIDISKEVEQALEDLNVSQYKNIANTDLDIATLVEQVNEKLSPSSALQYVSESDALAHLQSTISAHTTPPSITVEQVINDVKDIFYNAKNYSEEEIQSKIQALRTTLNNPLNGDRGLTDIEIAKTLLDLSELTNSDYVEDIFNFQSSVDTHLSQIIKEMALDNNITNGEHIVQDRGENITNIVVDSKKAVDEIIAKLKIISDKLGASLATAPQYYRFKYEGIDISVDNIQSLRSILLATASKLSLTLAYNIGQDSDYIPKIYTDSNGSNYEYLYADIYRDRLFNREGFGVANYQTALNVSKDYLFQSAMILKNLDAYAIKEDLNETRTNSSTENSTHQEIIDYAKNLYNILRDNNGTLTITNDNGGPNGEKEVLEIAINRMFDTKTALSLSDFGTDWKYSCNNGLRMATEEEAKREDDVYCYNSSGYINSTATLDSTIKPESETSKLDELITKVTLDDSIVKTGQELIDYIIGDNGGSTTPITTTPTNPTTVPTATPTPTPAPATN